MTTQFEIWQPRLLSYLALLTQSHNESNKSKPRYV
jgi:hypothetical protein